MNTIQTEKRKEYPYLYVLRCIAILGVVLLHCFNDFYTYAAVYNSRAWWLCNLLNPFARAGVPLFLMISGFLLLSDPRTADIGWFYKKRLSRILIPLLAWNVICFLIDSAIAKSFDIKFFLESLINNGYYYHLWYLYTLFGLYLFLPFLKRIVDSCDTKALLILLILSAFAGTIRPFINTTTPLYVYLFDPLTNGYMAFMIFGYILGRSDCKRSTRFLLYALGMLGFAYGIILNWHASSPDAMSFPANGGYGINHFLVAAALWIAARQLTKVKSARVIGALKQASDLTFGIYLIHAPLLNLFIAYVPLDASPVMQILIRFVAVLIPSALLTFVLRRIKGISKIV